MVSKIGHIKNPLTVIAIFAGIAEISGTVVLPFISDENQSTYIWFLMLFPLFLVGIFFATLNFNHRVLYAPSDYKDESNFVNFIGKASLEDQEQKIVNEIEEVGAEIETEEVNRNENNADSLAGSKSELDEILRSSQRNLIGDVTLSEKLAVNKLSKELGVDFKTDVRFDISDERRSEIFDAVGITDNMVHAVEVKLFRSKKLNLSRLIKPLRSAEIVAQKFKWFESKRFVLHIFVVMDSSDIDKTVVNEKILKFAKQYDFDIKVHVTTLNELQQEYQYNP